MSSPAPKQHLRSARRVPILAAIAAVLVAGGLADRMGGKSTATSLSAVNPPVPVAAPAAALSSSWFCAGAGNGTTGGQSGSVVIANSGPAPVQADVAVISTSGSPQRSAVTVAAHSSTSVADSPPGANQWSGAIVDVNAGAVAVSQVLDGSLGRSSQPCASSGSTTWYFPYGQTRVNADETLLLLNPYPTDSIVDMSFSTNQGLEQPGAFQGIDVPPDGIVAADLGSQMRRRSSIAATVTARVGRVVAWQVDAVTAPKTGEPIVGTPAASASLADPALPVAGITAPVGTASASTTWVWPDGLAGSGMDEQYVIYNPGAATADVRLSVGLSQGSAEPFTLTVGPYMVVPIVSEEQARIPAGVPHSASLVSTNGVPIVAARIVTADNASAQPGGTMTGLGYMAGAQMAAPRWLVPAPAADSSHRGDVVVYNDSAVAEKIGVSAAGGDAVGPQVQVAPGARASIAVPAGTNQPLVVASTGDMYVEYDLVGVGVTGLSFSPGVPLT